MLALASRKSARPRQLGKFDSIHGARRLPDSFWADDVSRLGTIQV